MTLRRHLSLASALLALSSLLPAVAVAQDIDDVLEDLESDVVEYETDREEAAAELGDAADDSELDDSELDDLGLDELLGDEPDDPVTAAGPTWLRGMKGFVELESRRYVRDRRRGRNDDELLLSAEAEFDLRLSDSVNGYFRPRVLVDALHGELRRFEPLEGYLTWRGDGIDVRAGQFIENWGIVDTYNPVDVLNRRDLGTDFLDPTRLGELGLRVRRQWTGSETIAEPTLSLYALPAFRPTRFPEQDGRFTLSAPGAEFHSGGAVEPSGSEGHFYAARFQAVLNTAPMNADTQLVVSHGPERTPTFQQRGSAIVPVYYGVTNVGFGLRGVANEAWFGTFMSKLTLKSEVLYKDAYSFDDTPVATPGDYLAYVVGVDRIFDRIFSDLDQLTVMVEYAGETGASDSASLFRPFRDDVVLRLFWEGNDFARTSVEFRALVDLEEDERIYELIVEGQLRAIHEDLTAFVSAQVFHQPSNRRTLLALFPNNTSVSAGLRWEF